MDPRQSPSATIRTPDQRLRVFISSTLGELTEERGAARRAVEHLRLAPVMFELGARPHPPRALYRAYLEQSDVFVGIYWQRYGWVAPGMEISGLEDEFRMSTGMPRLLYVKRPAPDIEPRLKEMLRGLQQQDDAPSYRPFRDADELHDLLLDDLAVLLAERFAQAQAPPAAVGTPPVVSPHAPAPATRLIGRDGDVDAVAALLYDDDRRLVTLTGAGGIGKTRLALAVLEATRARWPGGAAFVDVSAVTDESQLLASVGVALGIAQEGREQPLDALARRIGDHQVLLVLDNFEQVVAAAPAVAQLLSRCPRLHILVTSRVVLRVRGEQEWQVGPLELAPDELDPAALQRCSAIELFIDRARDVRPGFALTAANAQAVATLCSRLDGLPLALELAAARLRLLSPEQVLDRLGQQLDLPGPFTDLPERQRTLSATIQWSWSLLDRHAQQLFARASVFSGPFTLEAAEAVCGWGGVDTVEALSTLVDHSLLTLTERVDGAPAFRMLETLRTHAAHQLEAADEVDECLALLARYLVGVFRWAAPRLNGAGQATVLRALDAEVGNVINALTWAAEHGRELGPLLHALGDVWVWLTVRNALRGLPDLAGLVASSPAAATMTDRDRAFGRWLYAGMLASAGRYEEVVAFLEVHLDELLAHEPPERTGLMMTVLAFCRPYEHGGPARRQFEQAVADMRAAGGGARLGYTLAHYGGLLLADGDVSAARAVHEEALGIAEAAGDINLLAEIRYNLAFDDLNAGALESARDNIAIASRSYRDLDHLDGLARCAAVVAGLALAAGDASLAARLLGAVDATRRMIELRTWPIMAELERRLADQVRAALPEDRFSVELDAGRQLRLVDALEEGLAVHGKTHAAVAHGAAAG